MSDAIAELAGMRALARALAHGDADDLLQDAAVAALEHPPATDRPVKPWLATVILNRWRMNRRAEARRRVRELASDGGDAEPIEPLDRARMLQRLSDALVALDEPFRQTVIARYLDGKTAAQIAREQQVPAGTVRWRLKTGLERLRATLDDAAPRKQWVLALAPGVMMTTKTKIGAFAALLLLLLLGAGAWWFSQHRAHPQAAPVAAASGSARAGVPTPTGSHAQTPPAPHAEATAGQVRARVEVGELAGGVAAGRVINWSTGDGVANAELTFTGGLGAVTVRTGEDGSFELAPPQPGGYTLTAIAATGFLPYAPEYQHSPVHMMLAKDRAVRGVTVFLYPALDYHGRVVDEAGKAVAGARVRLVSTVLGEQVLEKLPTEWTADKDGTFVFHAPDDAVFEATSGNKRGWAAADSHVATTRQMTIKISATPPRDATISGKVIDETGKPIADVLVRAEPTAKQKSEVPRATAFATTGPDGTFELHDLDTGEYEVSAEDDDHAPTAKEHVAGGTHDLALTLGGGVLVTGTVKSGEGAAIPAFTLLAFKREGAAKRIVATRSVVNASGAFSLRVEPGTYDFVANASGWAPATVSATAPAKDLVLQLTAGATLVGQVVSSVDHKPLGYARIMRETLSGGSSAQPTNEGTVTRDDGTFELRGIPPGRLSILVGAGEYHMKIQAGMTASEGQTIGPMTIALDPVKPGEEPTLQLVGIGVSLAADGDALKVQMVVPGSGAQAAGIVVGDHIVSVDGAPVAEIGLDGAVARIRGEEGTTVAIGLQRGDQIAVIPVERRKIKA